MYQANPKHPLYMPDYGSAVGNIVGNIVATFADMNGQVLAMSAI